MAQRTESEVIRTVDFATRPQRRVVVAPGRGDHGMLHGTPSVAV